MGISGNTSENKKILRTPYFKGSNKNIAVKSSNQSIIQDLFKTGSIQTLIVVKDSSGGCKLTITEDSAPNTVNLLWLVPQFAVITVAEVLISVTGLEFAYTQERSKN